MCAPRKDKDMEAQRTTRQSFSMEDPATILTIRIPHSMRKALHATAKQANESESKIVNTALNLFLNSKGVLSNG